MARRPFGERLATGAFRLALHLIKPWLVSGSAGTWLRGQPMAAKRSWPFRIAASR